MHISVIYANAQRDAIVLTFPSALVYFVCMWKNNVGQISWDSFGAYKYPCLLCPVCVTI